jgi:hypothetical protein
MKRTILKTLKGLKALQQRVAIPLGNYTCNSRATRRNGKTIEEKE